MARSGYDDAPLRRTTDVIAEMVPLRGRRVIDVGCGDGSLVRFMAGEGARVTGVEARDSALARARAAEAVADEDYALGRGEALPFDGASADVVVYLNSLHHVPVPQQGAALTEARRVLKPEGRLLIIEPIAAGRYFEVVRHVEDETAVRAHACRVIRRAGELGLSQERELVYRSRMHFADFAAFEARVVAVDESRRARFDEVGDAVRRAFAEKAEREEGKDGTVYAFDQPMRASLLRPA